MNGIQVLLITGVAGLFLYYAFRLRNALLDMILLVIFAGLAVFFILFPEYTNSIAHYLGVGRGADLLFYTCILLFLFIILKLFARIRRLEQTITELVRKLAKDESQLMKNDDSKASV